MSLENYRISYTGSYGGSWRSSSSGGSQQKPSVEAPISSDIPAPPPPDVALKERIYTGKNLSKQTFPGNNYQQYFFDEANLEGVTFQPRVYLNKTTFEKAKMRRIQLPEAQLVNANLRKAQLQQANMVRVNLTHADLRKANLEGANLAGAVLEGVDFRGLGLFGWLFGANLKKANFNGAHYKTEKPKFAVWHHIARRDQIKQIKQLKKAA